VLSQLVALSVLSGDRLLRAKQHPAASASEVLKIRVPMEPAVSRRPLLQL